jgi:AbrB family looped-hinge helix DNA binding protein
MSKVTSKLQVTLPKAIADQYGISPGDEIEWIPAGDVIRVIPPDRKPPKAARETRMKLFDRAMQRYRTWAATQPPWETDGERGWKREDLYGRGRTR